MGYFFTLSVQTNQFGDKRNIKLQPGSLLSPSDRLRAPRMSPEQPEMMKWLISCFLITFGDCCFAVSWNWSSRQVLGRADGKQLRAGPRSCWSSLWCQDLLYWVVAFSVGLRPCLDVVIRAQISCRAADGEQKDRKWNTFFLPPPLPGADIYDGWWTIKGSLQLFSIESYLLLDLEYIMKRTHKRCFI